jgi:hypothetical protein
LPAKIIVTAEKGGSRVALIGTSGKQLLASEVFSEPRAKGATLRALRGLLGENVVVEDNTLASARPAKAAAAPTNGTTRPAPRKSATKAAATKSVAKRAVRATRKATKAAKARS